VAITTNSSTNTSCNNCTSNTTPNITSNTTYQFFVVLGILDGNGNPTYNPKNFYSSLSYFSVSAPDSRPRASYASLGQGEYEYFLVFSDLIDPQLFYRMVLGFFVDIFGNLFPQVMRSKSINLIPIFCEKRGLFLQN
jgi:hypothetical protein